MGWRVEGGRLSSSTSLASFLIADRMSSEGSCSSSDFALAVLLYRSWMRLIVWSGNVAWMDNWFKVFTALSRVLCKDPSRSAWVCVPLLFKS